ncbi:MAG TPA: hypothetical protein VMF11_05560 [Candidatus Baltobacteraceae bacterium]|nr:hypothetical protein [Candidatus Baltobacteraceae bacterium]
MPVDLRAALRAALDVTAPSFALGRMRERAAQYRRRTERRRARTMLSAAALLASLALFAGEYGAAPIHVSAVAVAPVPAPSPLAT